MLQVNCLAPILGLVQEIVVKADHDRDNGYDDDRRCWDCTNCCNNNNNNCVSGEMRVEEKSRGIIHVYELTTADVIRGITGSDRTSGWCKVEAITLKTNSDNVTSFDGFTENHMVVENGNVRPYGKRGKVSKSRVYTLPTECDAAVLIGDNSVVVS